MHEIPRSLSIRASAIRLETRTGGIPIHDGRRTVVRKIALGTGVPRRYFGLFKKRQKPHVAVATSIDTASRCWSHI